MKKVVYSVTRYGKTGQTKVTGLGYITDTDLIIACQSKENKPYIRVFEDCIKDCHPIPYKPGEHTGGYYEIRDFDKHSSQSRRKPSLGDDFDTSYDLEAYEAGYMHI